MEDLYNINYQAIDRYFKVLEKTGYVKDQDVNKVMLLTFLTEFIQQFQSYITEDDYRAISKLLSCLSNTSCLIPYRQFKELSMPMESYINNINVRIDEIYTLRHIELGYGLRLVNQ